MDQKIIQKTFLKALTKIQQNRKLLAVYLKDKRITQQEKSILQAWIDLRDAKFEKMIKSLKHFSSPLNFIESQRNLILGIGLNNKGHFNEASEYLYSAQKLMENEAELRHLYFICLYNQFVVNLNLQKHHAMDEILRDLDQLKNQSKNETLIVLRCRFILHKSLADYGKAEDVYRKLKGLQAQMPPDMEIGFLIDAFDYHVKVEEDEKAEKILKEMKKCKNFHFSANYKFMSHLLSHLVFQKPLYVYEHDFTNYPNLKNQIILIRSLEENNTIMAQKYWAMLSNDYPHLYGDFLEYKGEKCLFSRVISSYQVKATPHYEIEFTQSLKKLKKQERIIRILEKNGKMSQDEMAYFVWDKNDLDKSDLNKLSQLISRYNKKSDTKIKYKKGCYFIEKASLEKKAG